MRRSPRRARSRPAARAASKASTTERVLRTSSAEGVMTRLIAATWVGFDRALRCVAERARMARIGLAAGQVPPRCRAIDPQHLRRRALEMEALAGIGELDAGLATRRIEIGREILGRADDRGHARAGPSVADPVRAGVVWPTIGAPSGKRV